MVEPVRLTDQSIDSSVDLIEKRKWSFDFYSDVCNQFSRAKAVERGPEHCNTVPKDVWPHQPDSFDVNSSGAAFTLWNFTRERSADWQTPYMMVEDGKIGQDDSWRQVWQRTLAMWFKAQVTVSQRLTIGILLENELVMSHGHVSTWVSWDLKREPSSFQMRVRIYECSHVYVA